MGILDDVVDISDLGQRNLWVLWGKSGSGKTKIGASFPKPMLYVQVGDDGSNTIAREDGIKAKRADTVGEVKEVLTALVKDKKYKSVFIDTFSMTTNMWIDENATQKKKKMTQQMWGDLKSDQEELVRLAHKCALNHIVILSCHETMDTIEGMEDEILPDARPSVTKGARTYLEGMANYGIHTTKLSKEVEKKGETTTVVRYAAHLGANPYYWTKLQVSSDVKIPKLVINPTYDKLINIIQGGE